MNPIRRYLLRRYPEDTPTSDIPEFEFALGTGLDQEARAAGWNSARSLRSEFYGTPLIRMIDALERGRENETQN